MKPITELLVRRDGATTLLLAPEVGLFTEAHAPGALLGPGQNAGALLAAAGATRLVVPEGVRGRVVNELRERVQAPVGYGEVLYELAGIEEGAGDAAAVGAGAADEDGLLLRATQTGRFYHRPAPDEPPYAELGSEITNGQAIGLLEVMKTFSQVPYQAKGGLPARATLVRWLVEDGAEIRKGDALLEVEAR